MKTLLREFIRQSLREVDVLSPDKDPRMAGTASAAKAAIKATSSPSASQTSTVDKLPTGQPKPPGSDLDDKGNKKLASASPAYQSKEDMRARVQKVVAQKVKGGGIANDDDLARYLSDKNRIKDDGKFDDSNEQDLDLALTSLKMVPVSVWKQLR